MVNSTDFTKRLQKIITFYDESASSFALKVGVQRSSISHILSGRNKPSLDFIMKILQAYPEVDLYWLLNGKGEFPKQNPDLFETTNHKTSNTTDSIIEGHTNLPKDTPVEQPNRDTPNDSEIEKIVIFYKDGTFKSYKP